MASKARARARAARPAVTDAEVPVVGLREPCPCGSGKRYKACHGKDAARATTVLVSRPFEGLPAEGDWVALKEIVPAATAPLALAGEHADRDVTVVSVLPTAAPALVRADGRVLVALQTAAGSGDASRDVAYALEVALAADPGTVVTTPGLPGPGPRLQDLVDLDAPFVVTVHAGFDFWVEGAEDPDGSVAAGLERANAMVVPTEKVDGVESAYWCRLGEREHLRWVVPHREEALLDALARLHARGEDGLGEGSRLLGTFRAHGLLVPVWDLPVGTGAAGVAGPAAAFAPRLDAALADTAPLTVEERRARAGLANRQVTLR